LKATPPRKKSGKGEQPRPASPAPPPVLHAAAAIHAVGATYARAHTRTDLDRWHAADEEGEIEQPYPGDLQISIWPVLSSESF
jgi:hypothetical protein